MKPDFSPEAERAFGDRIDRAIKDSYQAAGRSSDDRMIERVFECLADDDLPLDIPPKPNLVLVPSRELNRLYVWTLKKYIEHQIRNLQLRGEIRA
jgi:hypothetical protein